MIKTLEKNYLVNIKKNAPKENVQNSLAQVIDYGTRVLGVDVKSLLDTKFNIITTEEAYCIVDDKLSEDENNGNTDSAEDDSDNLSALNHEPDLQGFVHTDCSPITTKDLFNVIDYLIENA